MSNTLARNDFSRGFIFTNGIYANQKGEYVTTLGVDSLSQDRGDITKIEQPSSDVYGQFEEVGQIPGELSRMTTTLTGRMSRTELSTFYQLFKKACAFDLHLHFGLCQKPDNFNQYDKALIFEDVFVTSFGTDPLVALSSGDRAAISETLDISIGNFYEVVTLKYTVKGGAQTVDAAVVDISVYDNANCGTDCDESSSGYDKLFAVTSDGWAYVSNDAGNNWTRNEIADGSTFLDGTTLGDYHIALEANGSLWYALRSDLLTLSGTVVYTELTTTISSPTAIKAFRDTALISQETGTVWQLDTALNLVRVESGSTTVNDLNDVAVGDGISVVVGVTGTVIYSYDNGVWFLATSPDGAATLNAVAIKNKSNWIVGSTTGAAWITTNSGRTWSRVAFPNYTSATGSINAIEVVTGHVVFMSVGQKLYRSIDGGYSWTTEPNSSLSFPSNSGINTILGTKLNVNHVLIGGSQGLLNTGLIVLGVGE